MTTVYWEVDTTGMATHTVQNDGEGNQIAAIRPLQHRYFPHPAAVLTNHNYLEGEVLTITEQSDSKYQVRRS
jgi:hypothetical protein